MILLLVLGLGCLGAGAALLWPDHHAAPGAAEQAGVMPGSLVPVAAQTAVVAAQELLPTVLSYDYRQIDTNLSVARRWGTTPFRQYLERFWLAERAQVLADRVVLKATTVGTGAVSMAGNRVVVLTFLDLAVTTKGLPTPHTTASAYRVSLVGRGGGWLIDRLDDSATPTPPAAWPSAELRAAERSARDCVTALLSVDPARLDAAMAAQARCTTGGLHRQLVAGRATYRDQVLRQQRQTALTVIASGVSEARAGRVRLVVYASSASRSSQQPDTSTRRVRLAVTATSVAGHWLVDSLSQVG
jgi:hypothetical protein